VRKHRKNRCTREWKRTPAERTTHIFQMHFHGKQKCQKQPPRRLCTKNIILEKLYTAHRLSSCVCGECTTKSENDEERMYKYSVRSISYTTETQTLEVNRNQRPVRRRFQPVNGKTTHNSDVKHTKHFVQFSCHATRYGQSMHSRDIYIYTNQQ
jgi:hypothetical protein